jgi:hypothetical protein
MLTAASSIYKTSGSYFGAATVDATTLTQVVASQGPRKWIKENILYPIGEFLDRNRSEVCGTSAGLGSAGSAGLCVARGGDPWDCAKQAANTYKELYDRCMSD